MPRPRKFTPPPKVEDMGDEVLVGGSYFKRNENLLSQNAKIKYTKEMLDEVKTSKRSNLYFAERHVNIITEDGKEVIRLRKFQKQLLKDFTFHKRHHICCSRQMGKALDINTLIPTPTGFKRMGDLIDGDDIYGSDGKIYKVVKAHDVMIGRPCYKITFDNGETVIADEDHLWLTENSDGVSSIRNTFEIYNTLNKTYYKIKNSVFTKNDFCIKSIEKTESVPVRCITVNSPDSLYLCTESFIPTHNTTVVNVYALWKACFFDHQRIAIIANKADTAQQSYERIRMSFEDLQIYMKPAVKSWRKDGFELANGSSIIISAASTSAIRGRAINTLIIDECAHIANDLMGELWKSVIPTISANSNGEIILISTPNGADKDNKFYQIYLDAQKEGSIWKSTIVNWWEIPGRDEEWKKKEIATIGSYHDFLQEYENCVSGDSLIEILNENNQKEILTINELYKKIS